MATEKKKRRTNWRKVLMKHGEKALRNPLRYAYYKAGEYPPLYIHQLRSNLRKKYKIMFPDGR